MTKEEALKLALQLVSNLRTHSWTVADEQLVITAIKEALAQPEQEPVAWMTITPYGEEDDIWYENPEGKLLDDWTYKPLYTTPPQRKPLTDEDLETMAEKYVTNCYFDTLKYARAIEAAHAIKEKNT